MSDYKTHVAVEQTVELFKEILQGFACEPARYNLEKYGRWKKALSVQCPKCGKGPGPFSYCGDQTVCRERIEECPISSPIKRETTIEEIFAKLDEAMQHRLGF